jgi:hypothetical protein
LLRRKPQPSPVLDMAVGKGKGRSPGMANGRRIAPNGPIDAKDAIIHGVQAFIHEHQSGRRAGVGDLSELLEHRKFGSQVRGGRVPDAEPRRIGGIAAPDARYHGDRSRQGVATDRCSAWAAVNGTRRLVGIQQPAGNARRVGGRSQHIPIDPGRRRAGIGAGDPIARQPIIVVAGLHHPADRHLFHVVEALNEPCLLFGPR